MLVINNICLSFGTKKVLNDVSVTISSGSIALFLGASGVGKSSLLRVLNTLQKPDQGTVLFNNKELDLSRYNQAIGMVFQHFNLFDHLSVIDNITLGLIHTKQLSIDQANIQANKVLEHYDLADKAQCYPAQLSGGQKQRVALVRSLALNPEVLCLDEPTSALDPHLSRYIAQQMNILSQQGYTILIASHDISLLDTLNCTIHLMQEGRIIQSALSHAFKQRPEDYAYINDFIRKN